MNRRRLFFVSLMCVFALGSITTEAWGDMETLNFSSSEGWGSDWNTTDGWLSFADLPLSGGSLSGVVCLPQMNVSGNSTAGWMLSGGTVKVWNDDNSILYVTGILGNGDIIPVGDHATAYTAFLNDIVVSAVNNPISSPVLDTINAYGKLDLSLSLHLSDPSMLFEDDILIPMTKGKTTKKKGYYNDYPVSGSMTVVPLPSALALGSIGLLLGSVGTNLAGWHRKRKTPLSIC